MMSRVPRCARSATYQRISIQREEIHRALIVQSVGRPMLPVLNAKHVWQGKPARRVKIAVPVNTEETKTHPINALRVLLDIRLQQSSSLFVWHATGTFFYIFLRYVDTDCDLTFSFSSFSPFKVARLRDRRDKVRAPVAQHSRLQMKKAVHNAKHVRWTVKYPIPNKQIVKTRHG